MAVKPPRKQPRTPRRKVVGPAQLFGFDLPGRGFDEGYWRTGTYEKPPGGGVTFTPSVVVPSSEWPATVRRVQRTEAGAKRDVREYLEELERQQKPYFRAPLILHLRRRGYRKQDAERAALLVPDKLKSKGGKPKSR